MTGIHKHTRFVWGINRQFLLYYGPDEAVLSARQVAPFYNAYDGKPDYKNLSLFRVQIGIEETTDEHGKTTVDFARERIQGRNSFRLDPRYSYTSTSKASFSGFGIQKQDIVKGFDLMEDDAKHYAKGNVSLFSFEVDFQQRRDQLPPLKDLYKPVFMTPTGDSSAERWYNIASKTWGNYRPITETMFSSWVFAPFETLGFDKQPVFLGDDVHELLDKAGVAVIVVGMRNMTGEHFDESILAERGDTERFDLNWLINQDERRKKIFMLPQAFPLEEHEDVVATALDGFQRHQMKKFLKIPTTPYFEPKWSRTHS